MNVWYSIWIPWILALVALHWSLPARFRVPGMVAAGATFLAIEAWPSAVVLAALTVGTYLAARMKSRQGGASLLAIVTITGGYLIYKCAIPHQLDMGLFIWIGLAYYVLRAIHYLVEASHDRLPAHGPVDFAAYMFFAPTLPLGPIHRFGDFMREVRRMRWDAEQFADGFERGLFGLAKVVLLADYLIGKRGQDVIELLAPAHPFLAEYLTSVCIGLGLFFSFAGYTDIAIGFALCMGIRVCENFDAPFLKKNLNEFWRSWHISLSSWCRDYVYAPLAAWTRRPGLAVLGSMLTMGLWHEVSLRYVMWGLYHGAGIVVWQNFQRFKRPLPLWASPYTAFASWFLTINFFIFGLTLTRQSWLLDAMRRIWTPGTLAAGGL